MSRIFRVALLLGVLAACNPKGAVGTKTYTQVCTTDAECKSGHCLQGSDGNSFCSQACTADTDCTSKSTLYCCEQIGADALCISPSSSACRAPTYGASCFGAGDPFCTRGSFDCLDVGGRNICTFDCISDTDCADVLGASCATLAGDASGRKVCATPDLNNLPRLTSDCFADRDCTTAGQKCLAFLDNDVSPDSWITKCSAEARGGKALGAACTSGDECDHGLCYRAICTASCLNDSHCGPGRICQPINFGFDNPTTMMSSSTVLSFCGPQNGSFRPCDSSTASCPSGEVCEWELRYDVSSSNVCSTPEPIPSGSPALSDTKAGPGESCSGLDANNKFTNLVDNKIKQCLSGFCAAGLNYCITPCRNDLDCANATAPEAMVCVFAPFFSRCERVNTTNAGAAIGADCSGTSTSVANGSCATGFCDLNVGKCAARIDSGAACTTSASCKSGRCLNGACAKLCRADSECAVGEACDATFDEYDVFGTTTTLDDALETPTFCHAVDIADPRQDCPAAACPSGQTCRPVLGHDGAYRGLCSTHAGADTGAACSTTVPCKSGLCGGDATNPYCLSVCLDDLDCTGGTKCVPVQTSRLSAQSLCAKPKGTAVLGAACTSGSACASSLCIDGKCAALCTRTDTLGADCMAGGTCARFGIGTDQRFTQELFDDRASFVDACIPGAVAWSNAGNLDACAAPKRFVFRPKNGDLEGSCQTPVDSSLADGQACQASTQCASGLCIDRSCRSPCAVSASCGTLACDLKARALLTDDNSLTDEVQACRPACTTDTDCVAGSKCEPGAGDRFCRVSCAGDNDCAPGQTCSADLGGGLRLCGP